MQEILIDGVPVFVAEGTGPTTVGLVFGVGRADETFVRGGLTHLVEHLTMSAVGRTTYESNASVDLNRTEFTASGTPEQVREFLDRVCRALGDLPVERLRVEADVLRTEGGAAVPPAVDRQLTERYGVLGPGLASVREPALASLTAQDVDEWVRTRFTRQNAALWLSGPLPEGLALPLADGLPPPRPPLWRAEVTTPGWLETGDAGVVSIGAELPPGVAGSVTLEILRRRVEDELRHRRGVAYAVGADRLALDPDTRFGVVVTDVRAGQEDLVVAVRSGGRCSGSPPTAPPLRSSTTSARRSARCSTTRGSGPTRSSPAPRPGSPGYPPTALRRCGGNSPRSPRR